MSGTGRVAHLAGLAVVLAALAGCGGGRAVDAVPVAQPEAARTPARAVALGASQDVSVASAFGPGRVDVSARITVLTVRDHVAGSVRPRTAAAHWASADVRVCRTAPVVLGFPAWVLGDDAGRTAEAAKVVSPQFPRPTLPSGPGVSGCSRGWVTFVTPNELHPTKVTFEQTRQVPLPWRIRASGGAR